MSEDDFKTLWLGDQVKGTVRQALADGLLAAAQGVMADSVAVAPKETGELRASAYAQVDASTLVAIVGYDVPRDVKSIVQHEDLKRRHPDGEQAKFLEKPLYANRANASAQLVKAVGRKLA